jgi:ATP/maltotriose-dependent transcriptional regulator MalT
LLATALAGLMRLSLREGDLDAVERLADEAEQLAVDADDPSLRRYPLHMRAEAARMRGYPDFARNLYDASMALNRDLGDDRMVGLEMANKSWVEISSGRLDDAERLLRGSLERCEDGDSYGRAFCLLGLARVQLERGDEHGARCSERRSTLLKSRDWCGIRRTSQSTREPSRSLRASLVEDGRVPHAGLVVRAASSLAAFDTVHTSRGESRPARESSQARAA